MNKNNISLDKALVEGNEDFLNCLADNGQADVCQAVTEKDTKDTKEMKLKKKKK